MAFYGLALVLLATATATAWLNWRGRAAGSATILLVMRLALLGAVLADVLWIALALKQHARPSSSESMVILAAAAAGIVLYIHLSGRFKNLHVFCLPLIILIQVCALLLGGLERSDDEIVGGVLLIFHYGCILVGSVAFLAAAAAGVVYLRQVARLKNHGSPGELGKAPALEVIERFNQRAVTIGFALLSAGMILGLVLNRQQPDPISLADPKLIFTAMAWLVYALLLHVRYLPRFRGRQAALLSIVGFALILFTFVVVEFLPTRHP